MAPEVIQNSEGYNEKVQHPNFHPHVSSTILFQLPFSPNTIFDYAVWCSYSLFDAGLDAG